MNIRFIIITALMILSVGKIFSQTNSIMIKSVESFTTAVGIDTGIYIIDSNNKTTKVELDKHDKTGIYKNMKTLKGILDKYLAEGYKINSSNSILVSGRSVLAVEHTYYLVKEN